MLLRELKRGVGRDGPERILCGGGEDLYQDRVHPEEICIDGTFDRCNAGNGGAVPVVYHP